MGAMITIRLFCCGGLASLLACKMMYGLCDGKDVPDLALNMMETKA